ncbi:MAG: hypothetical protein WBA54_06525 [Acidaminobacteraceae bacterium]
MNLDKTLEKITKEFEKHNIRWGLGASGLLSFYGIVEHANDIDIMVSMLDVEEAKVVLSELGEKKDITEYEKYSDRYDIYTVDDVSIDLIGGFTINSENFQYKFYFSDDLIAEYKPMLSVKVPLLYLRDWYFMYIIMGDPKSRTILMEDYFIQKNYHEDEFTKFLEYDLTEDQKYQIISLMYKLRAKRRC